MLTKDWGDLKKPRCCQLPWSEMEAHNWWSVSRHAEVRGQVGTDGSTNSSKTPSSRKQLFRSLLPHIRRPTSHLLPQLACAVSTTAQKPEDEWTAADVKETEQAGEQSENVLTHSSVFGR